MRTLPSNPGFAPFGNPMISRAVRARFQGLGNLGTTSASTTEVEQGAKGVGISVAAGAVGTAIATSTVGVAAAGAVASAASAVGIGASVGSVVPVIGTAIGAIVGLVAGALLKKNYLNVAQMNAAEANEIAAFTQYKSVAGQAPGRQFGLAAMTAVWKGCLHSSTDFTKNNAVQCFHEGCSAHPGNASLIDDVLDPTNLCADNNCFANVLPMLKALKAGMPASSAAKPPASTLLTSVGGRIALAGLGGLGSLNGGRLPALHPATVMRARAKLQRMGLSGLGSLGATATTYPAGVPEAKVFIDQFFIPLNSSPSKCTGNPCYWAAPSTAIGRQILYDVADAWLAVNAGFTTTPFIAAKSSASSSGAAITSVSTATTVPAQVAATASTTVTPAAPGAGTITPTNSTAVTSAAISAGSAAGLVYIGNYLCTGTVSLSYKVAMPCFVDPASSDGSTVNVYVYYPGAKNAGQPANFAKWCRMPLATAQQMAQTMQLTASGSAPPVLAPTSTPQLPSTAPAVAASSGAVATTTAATSNNLDAQLASQGFARVGTTSDGYPLYSQAGQVYEYQNGSLFPYGSVAQVAATGSAGTGVSTPATGLDPTTAQLIANAIQSGMTAQQAADAAATALQAQGVPVDATTSGQLLATAQQYAAAPAASSGSSNSTLLLLGGGALLLYMMAGKKKAA